MAVDAAKVKKKRKKPETQVASVMAEKAGKGMMAGWKEKEGAVEGFGCVHLALKNVQPVIAKPDFEHKKKEDQYMHGTACHGTCNNTAEMMDWKKHLNKISGNIVHICSVCTGIPELMKTSQYCIWYCDACFLVAKDAEAIARGDDPTKRSKRARV